MWTAGDPDQARAGPTADDDANDCQALTSVGSEHCLKVWTNKQQVVSLSSAESELWLGIQSVAKDLGISCGVTLHLHATATMCLVNRRGLGKAKHVDVQNLWIQEASKSGRFITKKVGTNVNPADLVTKPLPRPKIEQLMSLMGDEFMKIDGDALKNRGVPVLHSRTLSSKTS